MRHALSIFFALFLCSLHAQVNNIYTSGGISQTFGAPTYRPGAKGNIVAIDTVTGTWYVSRDRNSVNWLSMGQRIEQISGCSAPAYTPNKYNSDIVMNACATPELYYHSGGGTWVCLNCASAGATDLSFTGSDSPYKLNSSTGTDVLFRAGTNVTLSRSGDTLDIAASGGITTVSTDATLSGDGSVGTPLKIAQQSATSGQVLKWNGITWLPATDAGTTYTAGTGIDVTGTVISNTGDLSATNELNTAALVTGGNLRITDAGGNLDVPVTDIAPVQAVAAGTGISISGTSTRTITNSAPDQTVSITGAGINAVTGTYPNFTVTGTEVDGSTSNELQTLSILGQDITLSNGGGTVTVPGTDLGLFDNGDNTLDITSSTGLPIRVAGGNLIGVYDDGGQLTIDFNGLILSGSGSNNRIPIWSGASSLNSSAKFTYDEVANRGLIGTTTSSGRTLGVYADIFLEKHSTDLNSAIESERNAVSFLEGGSGEGDNFMVLSRGGHVEGTAGSPAYTSKNSILAQTGAIFGNSKIQFYYNGLVTSGTTFTPTSVMEYNGGTSTWSLANLSVTNSLAVTSPLQVTEDAERRAVFANANDTRRNSFEILSGGTGESDNGLFFNRAFKTTGAASGTYTSTNSIIRPAGIRVLGQKIELIGSPSTVTSGSTFTPTVYLSTDIVSGKIGIGNSNPQRTLHVTGELRVSDLSTDTPTQLVGADGDGDVAAVSLATGLSMVSGALTPDDASATNEIQTIDTFSLSGAILSLSLVNDNVPAQTVNLSTLPVSAAWGAITGTLSDQMDLQTALDAKAGTTEVYEYKTTQTNTDLTIPAGVQTVEILCVGGGGGGGSGRKGPAAAIRCGGGSGGAGAVSIQTFSVSELGVSTLRINLPAAAAGGSATTTNSTNGSGGTAGGATTVGTTGGVFFVKANGGAAGGGGTATNGTAGAAATVGMFLGGAGIIANASGNAGGNAATVNTCTPSGGGSGGGITTANAQSAGGTGGTAYYALTTGGTAGTTGGGNGGNGSITAGQRAGSGGGGGGSNLTGNGGNGGNGARGAGGGGGGAAVDSVGNSGAGGSGGIGYVRVTFKY